MRSATPFEPPHDQWASSLAAVEQERLRSYLEWAEVEVPWWYWPVYGAALAAFVGAVFVVEDAPLLLLGLTIGTSLAVAVHLRPGGLRFAAGAARAERPGPLQATPGAPGSRIRQDLEDGQRSGQRDVGDDDPSRPARVRVTRCQPAGPVGRWSDHPLSRQRACRMP